ncbi:MAG: ribonuclease III [Deltaproteobacteria bacterium]|nr:ribonuclease III [Deltaproteobacteria bacterium]
MRFGIVKSCANNEGAESKKKPASTSGDPLGREHYHKIEEALGYKFTNLDWLERALTHRSIPGMGTRSDYERLEFIGDAVIDLAVSHLLLDAHRDAREGELSKMRAALVNAASLAEIGRKLELSRYIKLSRGELANGGAERPSILEDVVEALMGAIYREAGYETAFKCIESLFGELVATVMPTDPKTDLQEALHSTGSEAPVYMLECVEGPEHAPTFISVVNVDGQIVGRGSGPTKKASQQAAAAEALKRLAGFDHLDRVFMGDQPASVMVTAAVNAENSS